MCGIAGIVSFKENVSLQRLKNMTDSIIHRGPDGEGQWINETAKVGFGHRRLSIIDLSENGKQPMHYLEKRYTITFNGEIYNYIELKKTLIDKGYKFVSHSDTEVLLALFHEYGKKCLEHLDGMFAFAIWDEKERKLFLARDRFGEKPLYYAVTNDGFYFGSEMKVLWAGGVVRKINSDKLSFFLRTGAVYSTDAGETFFESIRQLNAANFMWVDLQGNISNEKYWSLKIPETSRKITLEKAKEEWEELFNTSLARRMRSDVTVGTSLSGGLDSSYIVAMLCDKLPSDKKVNSFSAKFPSFERDESEFIDAVVEKLGKIKPFSVIPSGEELMSDFEKLVAHQEEPFQSSSIYAQYRVFQLARENKTVVLIDGQGADELLAGYLPYYEDYLRQLFFWNNRKYKKELSSFMEVHGDYTSITPYEQQETLRMKLGRHKQKLFNKERAYPSNYLKHKLVSDLCGLPLQTLLRYADRNAMAHSVEVRLPFLNHQMAEWMVSLPDEFLLHEGWFKYVLRVSAQNYLPEKVVWRKRKIGYEPPQKKWLTSGIAQEKIKEARKLFNIQTEKENSYTDSQEWRLLMAKSLMDYSPPVAKV